MSQPSKNTSEFHDLCEIVRKLRGPDGCPWDKEQSHSSLAKFAIEEAFELAEALDQGEPNHLKEELGDCLFQVILNSQIAEEMQLFDIKSVIQQLCEKMIRRHPHVFGNELATTADQVLNRWQEIKAQERPKGETGSWRSPSPMPALQRAQKVGELSKNFSFDWKNVKEVEAKFLEEYQEIKQSEPNPQHMEEEMGDLLFATVQWARHLGFDAETCLRKATLKFENRMQWMLRFCQAEGSDFLALTDAQKEALWSQAKKSV